MTNSLVHLVTFAFTLFGVALLVEAPANAAQQGQAPSPVHFLQSGGTTRSYHLSVSKSASEDGPIPVIFAFHGHGQDGVRMERYTGLDDLPALVVYPQGEPDTAGKKRAWESAPYASTNAGEKDSEMVRDILAELNEDYDIDQDRIYATGKSNGGGFAAKLACNMPEIFAAVVPVAGAYYPDTNTSCSTGTTPERDVSVMEIHGEKDATIHYLGGKSHGVHYEPAKELTAQFAHLEGCSKRPDKTNASARGVIRWEWTNCHDGVDVKHLDVTDGGHNWPGSSVPEDSGPGPYNTTLHTTNAVWAFFESTPQVVESKNHDQRCRSRDCQEKLP